MNKNKLLAYIGCLGLIGVISTEFGVIGILPQIAAYYHISIDKAGYLLSSFAMVIAFTGPFMMLYSARFNAKRIMLLATALFLISNIASSLKPAFSILLLLRVIPAFLQPVFISLVINAAGKGISHELQIRYTGIVIGGIALSQVTIIPLATYISNFHGWQTAYIVQAFINLIVYLLIWIYMPKNPGESGISIGNQLKIFRKPAFIISIAMNFFLIAAWFCSYSYFADYLNIVRGINKKEISSYLFLFGLTSVFGNTFASRLLAKNLIAGTVFFVCGTLLITGLWQITVPYNWYNIFCIAIWGFFYGPCFLTAVAFMQSAAPQAKSFSNTLQTSFGNLGVSAGTMISGCFITTHGVCITPWIGSVFGCLALVCIAVRVYIEKVVNNKANKQPILPTE